MDGLRKFLIFIADLAAFFSALFVGLFARHFLKPDISAYFDHIGLFLFLFIGWLIIAYILDLLKPRNLTQNSNLFNTMVLACLAHLLCSFSFLYLFSSFFSITPKTNLVLFEISFFLLAYILRTILGEIFGKYMRVPVIFLDKSVPEKVIADIKNGLHVGYAIISAPPNIDLVSIKESVGKQKSETMIVVQDSIAGQEMVELIFRLKLEGYIVISLSDFYENVLLKEPLEILDEKWFIENLRSLKIYDFSKRAFDIILSFILLIVLLPVAILIALAVKLGDGGPVFYMHTRAGKNNKEFMLYKFRSMVPVHNNFVWTLKNDDRVTPVGKFIRRTHLDEIPQLINIFRGDISFVGPRPEQVKIIEAISKNVPYYDVRSFVKPGLTGWAQLHYRASASMDEVAEKLKYDLYYIKKRNFILDFLILVKTVKLFFVNPE